MMAINVLRVAVVCLLMMFNSSVESQEDYLKQLVDAMLSENNTNQTLAMEFIKTLYSQGPCDTENLHRFTLGKKMVRRTFILAVEVEDNVLNAPNITDDIRSCAEEARNYFFHIYTLLGKAKLKEFLQYAQASEFIGTDEHLLYTKRQYWIKDFMTHSVTTVWGWKVDPMRIIHQLDLVQLDTRLMGYFTMLELVLKQEPRNDTLVLQLTHGIQNMTSEVQNNTVNIQDRHSGKLVTLSDMKRLLPTSVQELVFDWKVCILSERYNKTHDGEVGLRVQKEDTSDKYRHSLELKYYFSTRDIAWRFERVGDGTTKYRIVNAATGEYLYASVLQSNQDERKLYTWKSKQKPPTSVFDVKLHGDNVKLRNVAYNEYVLARGGEVFTWTPGGEEAYSYVYTKGKRRKVPWRPGTSQWRIIDCNYQ